jgi:hypothetical protein
MGATAKPRQLGGVRFFLARSHFLGEVSPARSQLGLGPGISLHGQAFRRTVLLMGRVAARGTAVRSFWLRNGCFPVGDRCCPSLPSWIYFNAVACDDG